jgi:hypothetical protein
LLTPLRQWNPNVLRADWTFSQQDYAHLMFNVLAGIPMLVMSPLAVGWLGRIACWVLLTLGLLRLGEHLGVRRPLAGASIILWILLPEQSLVGGEWMYMVFEAKVVAYVALLFSLDAFLRDRDLRGALLLGLATDFHPAVGAVAALGVGMALLVQRYPLKRLGRIVLLSFVVALPGLIPALILESATTPHSQAAWEFLSVLVMPSIFDAFSFAKRDLLLFGLLVVFCLAVWIQHRDDRKIRFVMAFLTGLGVVFAGGFVARGMGRFDLLKLTPFRLFPLFALILFLLLLWRVIGDSRGGWRTRAIQLLGIVVLCGLPDPIAATYDNFAWVRMRGHSGGLESTQLPGSGEPSAQAATSGRDDLVSTMVWVSRHTPREAVIITPPWRQDSFYWTRRAQIASWLTPTYDRIDEWYDRITALTGKLEDPRLRTGPWAQRQGPIDVAIKAHYDGLSEQDVQQIVRRYGGDYLISKGTYSFPVLFDSGSYRVYRL